MAELSLVSRAEYARMRGCSHTAVNKAVSAGRIPLVEGKIDPAAADLAWPRNPVVEQQQLLPREGSRAAEELRERRAKATLAELAAARATGETVSVAEVREALAEMVSRVKARLLMVPAEVGMTFGIPVQREVQSRIESALQELSDEAA